MKILILSITLSTSVLSGALNDFSTFLNLPEGLEIGKTLITDLDPMSVSKDGSTFFANAYDAHFNELGFLEKIVLDQTKDHDIPTAWEINWNTNLQEVQTALSALGSAEVVNQDMSKSRFANSFNEVILTTDDHIYHFQIIDWKDGSENQDGLSSIVVTSL